MAAADAIWWIFIEPKAGREDATSLMHFVALQRPKETGKISSDPGLCRMHEVIAHTGAALRLDARRLEVLRWNPAWTSLQVFADSKPTFELIAKISEYLTSNYIAGIGPSSPRIYSWIWFNKLLSLQGSGRRLRDLPSPSESTLRLTVDLN
jgi:hypothetical protein